mmetsp:Transcript_18204/g.61874  ORF Transcript_18204/g.61874 Transcript_18204/m.61874 type:complete len:335 (-) Transcript_18204:300-1304(-)
MQALDEVISRVISCGCRLCPGLMEKLLYTKHGGLRIVALCRLEKVYSLLYDQYGPYIGWLKRYHSWYNQTLFVNSYPMRTLLCPLPFDPENKVAQKAFATYLGIPAVETFDHVTDLASLKLTCEKHESYVLKPAVGGMSVGVSCVRNNVDLSTGKTPDVELEVANVSAYNTKHFGGNKRDYWIVEKLHVDELGCFPLRDFKFILCGGDILAVMIMSEVEYDCSKNTYGKSGTDKSPYTYACATVDKDYNLMEPWNSEDNPFVRILVRDHRKLTPKPGCWQEMVKHAQSFGSFLNTFCRVDFFATTEGARFCEIETLMNPMMFSKKTIEDIKHLW